MNIVDCGKKLEVHATSFNKKPIFIGMDGGSGSGKSTFSFYLNQRHGFEIVSLEAFFPELSSCETLEDLQKLDFQRFVTEVLEPLKEGKHVIYTPDMPSAAPISIAQNDIIVIEGLLAMHPVFRPYYDIKVFMTATKEGQLERIKAREGNTQLDHFIQNQFPLEEAYFKAYDVEKNCDYVFNFMV